MSNMQALFDKVATHLLTQGTKSIDDDGSCLYRGEHNRKCAIGCLIPDWLYTSSLENKTATQLPEILLKAMGVVTFEESELLYDLQVVHDREAVEDWSSSLIKVAESFNLDPKVVTNWPKA